VAACSNFGLLGDEEEPLVKVANLEDGGYLEPGLPILVEITAPPGSNSVVSIVVTLLDDTDGPVWETVFDFPPLNESIEVGPFAGLNFPAGVYSLRFDLVTDTGATITEWLTFFHVVGDFAVQAINSFPPVSAAGTTASLAASLLSPDGLDPYLRWWQGTELIAEGLMSDGLAQASWPTPDVAGIYAVSLELFPIEPPRSGMVAPQPRGSLDVAVYVVAPAATEASAQHATLLRFDATLQDSGNALGAEPARVVSGNAPLFTALGSDIGYVIDPDRVLELPRSLIPTDTNGPLPFSITLSLLAESARGTLLRSAAGPFELEITLGEDRVPVVAVGTGAVSHQLRAKQALAENPTILTLSATPTAAGISLAWYEDGEQTTALLDAPMAWEAIGGWEGTTQIGGTEFTGVLGEVAVYTQDEAGNPSTDPAAAFNTLGRAGKTVLAAGFDGSSPAGVFPDTLLHNGGFGWLAPRQSLDLPTLDLAAGSVDVGLAAPSALWLVSGPTTLELFDVSQLRLSWQTSAAGIAVTPDADETATWLVAPASLELRLSAAGGAPLLIDYVVVRAATAAVTSAPAQ
jgi:hypothetical protein